MKSLVGFNLLKAMAFAIMFCSAIGSVYFVVDAGRNNNSILLKALFVIWVLLPFLSLIVLSRISANWSFNIRSVLYWLMLVITIGSLLFYSRVLKIHGSKNASVFLIVPFLSLLILMTFFFLARKRSNDI